MPVFNFILQAFSESTGRASSTRVMCGAVVAVWLFVFVHAAWKIGAFPVMTIEHLSILGIAFGAKVWQRGREGLSPETTDTTHIMKTPKIGILLCAIAIAILLAGCKTPSPALYTPQTNVVEEVVVLVTNPITGAITLETNQVLEIVHTPNTNTLAKIKSAGDVVDLIIPGAGTAATAVVGGVLTLIGQFFYRRHKAKKK